MDTTKNILAGISIVELVLILGLSTNVSTMPYINIENATQNFAVVHSQYANITPLTIVKNASNKDCIKEKYLTWSDGNWVEVEYTYPWKKCYNLSDVKQFDGFAFDNIKNTK